MADDHSQPVADQVIPPVDPSAPPSPIQIQTPDLTNQSDDSPGAQRPETPVPADDKLADEKESTESASLNPSQTSEAHRPDSPKLADEEKVASENSVQTQSSEIIQTEVPELADKQSEATASSQVDIEVKVEEKPIEPETASEKPQETISEKVEISSLPIIKSLKCNQGLPKVLQILIQNKIQLHRPKSNRSL